MTLGDDTIRQFADLQTWKRGGVRAPHKHLLALYALGRVQQGKERLQEFWELEPALTRLLVEFGPPRRTSHPEYPFWRMQKDGIWEVVTFDPLIRRASNSDPLKSELRRVSVLGGFTDVIDKRLRRHPELLRAVAARILEAHFPSTLHAALATSVGLDLNGVGRPNTRDASFRHEVLSAWGHKCGFCGYDLKLDGIDLGLEAAHLRWVQAGGPDILSNGIACCSLHHVAFDRGAIGIDEHFRIIVSSRIHGGEWLQGLFVSLHGKAVELPSRKIAVPRKEYVEWHIRQVFSGESRD